MKNKKCSLCKKGAIIKEVKCFVYGIAYCDEHQPKTDEEARRLTYEYYDK